MIDRALDHAYPFVAAELKRLSYEGKGMDGRGMCRSFLTKLTQMGWGLIPPEDATASAGSMQPMSDPYRK